MVQKLELTTTSKPYRIQSMKSYKLRGTNIRKITKLSMTELVPNSPEGIFKAKNEQLNLKLFD